MECWNRGRLSLMIFLLLHLLIIHCSSCSAAAATSVSDGIFETHALTGRNLLQAKKACPVDFEFLNYTIIDSQCKGPKYPANLCCAAFKKFACPYAEELNDSTNECSSTMLSYINLHGKYPPGLFSSLCREGKLGLECPALSPSESVDPSGSQIMCIPSFLQMLTAAFLLLMFSY